MATVQTILQVLQERQLKLDWQINVLKQEMTGYLEESDYNSLSVCALRMAVLNARRDEVLVWIKEVKEKVDGDLLTIMKDRRKREEPKTTDAPDKSNRLTLAPDSGLSVTNDRNKNGE